MKKFFAVLLALVLISAQAFAYTITERVRRVGVDARGNDYVQVDGDFALDSSHPAEGETLLPTQLGMSSFYRVSIEAGSPPGNWGVIGTGNGLRRFGFDYTANRFYVISVRQQAAGTAVSDGIDVSGEVTYNLAYLTKVAFHAVGPITG